MKGSCFLSVAVILLVWAQPLNGGELSKAEKIVCRYCSGTSVDWYQKKPQPLIVMEEFVERMCPDVLFTDIDRNMGTAVSMEEELKSVVSVWESPRTLSFVEMSYGGAMVVTTIFQQKTAEKDMYLSVRSDHTFNLQFPVPVQFFGACEVLE
jgi:hypothetical protein